MAPQKRPREMSVRFEIPGSTLLWTMGAAIDDDGVLHMAVLDPMDIRKAGFSWRLAKDYASARQKRDLANLRSRITRAVIDLGDPDVFREDDDDY